MFEWIVISEVDKTFIDTFDSGDYVYNDFLKEKAKKWQLSGEAVTYLCVDNERIDRIYGYASINTNGLLFTNDREKLECLHCVEIRLFAIAKELRKKDDKTKNWSEKIFKSLLQELYMLSMNTIGFNAIFLNSNHCGYNLYTSCGFSEIKEYVIAEEDEKLSIEECTPLLLIINEDNAYDFFSE